MIHHMSGKLNKGAYAPSRRYLLLFTLDFRITRFELIKEKYKNDEDFQELFENALIILRKHSTLIRASFLKEVGYVVPSVG